MLPLNHNKGIALPDNSEKITEEEARHIYSELFKSNSQEAASFNNLVGDVDFNRELVNGWLTGIGRSDLITATPEPVQAAAPKKPKAEKKPAKSKPQQDNTADDLQNEPVTESAPAEEPEPEQIPEEEIQPEQDTAEPEPVTADADQHDTGTDGTTAEESKLKIRSRDGILTAKDRINKLTSESAKEKLNTEVSEVEKIPDITQRYYAVLDLAHHITKEEEREQNTLQITGIPEKAHKTADDSNNIAAFLGTPNSEKKNIEVEFLDTSLAEKEIEDTKEIERKAEEIYKSGKALEYICESINKYHKGDKLQTKALMLSYAVTKVRNEKGLNIMLTGDAGKGKSHLTETGLEHLPIYAYDKARYSDKALFHHNIPDAQVLVFDDQALSEILQECIKVMTTDIKVHSKYKTVNTHKKVDPNDPNGNAETLNLPANCPIWIAKVEPNGDEQIRDRCICLWIDESEEQDMSIRSFQNQTAINPDMIIDDTTKKISCKIWDFMPKENEATVVIPYANDIIQRNVNDHRKYDQLLDVIKASAVMAADSRYKNEKGYVEASISDFMTACSIMNSIIEGAGGSIDGTPRASIDFLYKCLANKPTGVYTRSELQDLTGKSESAISRIINGRKVTGTNEYVGGLKDLCPAISDVDKTAGDLRMKSILWNREVFQQWQKDRNTLFVMEPDRKALWEEIEKQKHRETINE